MEGTGAVVAAGFMSAQKLIDTPVMEQKVIVFGGGSASAGVAHQIAEVQSF